MAYINEAFYRDSYFGENAGADFHRLASRASDDIDAACPSGFVLDALPSAQATLVKKAVAAQLEFYVQNGDTYNEAAGGSESIGSFSRSSGPRQRNPAGLCPRARSYLEQTGLMYRGVAVLQTGSEEDE